MNKFNLAAWALRHKSIIYYFIAVLFTFGIFSYNNMGRMEDPDFTIRTMVIGASWPGASPQEMSEKVTNKLEEKIRDLPGLDYTKSFTDGGKSVIYVNLREDEPAENVRDKWTEVRNMVKDEWPNLPAGVQGPQINDRFDDVYGTIYAVTGNDYTYEEKRAEAEKIKRILLSVPHVKKIELLGVQQQQLKVQMDKDKLAAYHISSQTILDEIKEQSSMAPSGMINTDTNNVYLRVNGLFDSVDAVKELPIRINDQTLRLGDIAKVTMDYANPQKPSFYYNGQEAIGIAISMEPGANNIEFGKDLADKVASIKGEIPTGFTIHQVSNQPKIVNDSIGEFSHSLFEAILIVLAVSFISLGIRSGIVVALTIPVVVCTTFIIMYLSGISLHKISLGALIISLGLLVDDAIIVVEMMSVKLEEGNNHFDAATAAFKSTAFPMLSGTLITCAGFLPVSLAEGMVAEFCQTLFIVVGIALLVSWVASVLVSPVLGYKIIESKEEMAEKDKGYSQLGRIGSLFYKLGITKERTKRLDDVKTKVGTSLYKYFSSILDYVLGHQKLVIIGTLGLLIVSMAMYPLVKQEFFPPSTRNEILVNLEFPQGSSLAYTKTQSQHLDDILSGDKRIDQYTTYVGQGAPRFILTTDPELQRDNYMQVVIVANSVEDRNSLRNELNEELAKEFPDAFYNIQYLQTGPPSKYPVMFRVTGPDENKVKDYDKQVEDLVSHNGDIADMKSDWPGTVPTAKIYIDPLKARLMGVDSYNVSLALQGEISGVKSGEYYDGDQNIPITFNLGSNVQHNLSLLQTVPIQTKAGSYVPLNQVAKISMNQEDGIIWHRNMEPTITIRATVKDNIIGTDVAKKIDKELDSLRKNMPPGYTVQLDGSAEKSDTALHNILVKMPVVIFVVMTILMFQLKKIPLMIMALLTAPLGMIGVVLIMLITRTPMGFMAILGAIALSGMIIRNTIILLDQIETHRAMGQGPREAIINSALLRFRPIMLTAAAAMLGMIPLLTKVFWAPMAMAFIGGLIVATFLTLLVVPAMYAAYYKVK